MFCGECGSSTSATPESRRRGDPRPGDTTVLERGLVRESGVVSVPVEGFHAAVASPPEAGDEGSAAASVPGAADLDAHAEAALADSTQPRAGVEAAAASDEASGADRALATFVLTFSTGETRTVFGTGLIGRRPMPQPGETYDHLVQIADRSLSVSKTHLEFGEHDEELWVADRFSANGTVVHRPDAAAVRCEPGRRYLVPRGSRVEIAEQSFRVE